MVLVFAKFPNPGARQFQSWRDMLSNSSIVSAQEYIPEKETLALLESGRRHEAIQRAVQTAESYAQQYLSEPQRMFHAPYGFDAFRVFVHSHGCKADLVAAFDRRLDGGADALAISGWAHEWFGDSAAAIERYRQCLQLRPHDMIVRLRLTRLELADGTSLLAEHLNHVREDELNTYCCTVIRVILNMRWPYELRLRRFDEMVQWGRTRRVAEPENLAWASELMEALVSPAWMDVPRHELEWGPVVPHLHATHSFYYTGADRPWSNDVGQADARMLDAALHRMKLHRRLCEWLMELPGFKSKAFASWYAIPENALGPLDDETLSKALASVIDQPVDTQSILREISSPNNSPAIPWAYRATLNQVQPIRIVARHYGMNASDADVEETRELVKMLRDADRIVEAKMLENLYALYAAPADEFMTVGMEMIRQALQRSEQTVPDWASEVIDVWNNRGLSVDLTPIFLSDVFALDTAMSNELSSRLGVCGKYLICLARRATFTDLRQPLRAFKAKAIHATSSSGEGVMDEAQRKRHKQVEKQLLLFCEFVVTTDARLAMAALDVANEFKFPTFGQWQQTFKTLEDQLTKGVSADQWLQLFDEWFLMCTVDNFQPHVHLQANGQSLWNALIPTIRRQHPALARDLIDRLHERPSVTFGARLLHMALENRLNQHSFLELLAEDIQALQTLTDRQTWRLFVFARELPPPSDVWLPESEANIREVQSILERGWLRHAEALFAQVQQAAHDRDLVLRKAIVSEFVNGVLVPMENLHSDQLVPAFAIAWKHSHDEPWDRKPLQEFLPKVRWSALLDICSHPELAAVDVWEILDAELPRRMLREYGERNLGFDAPGFELASWIEWVGQVEHDIVPRDARCLAPAIATFLEQWGAPAIEVVLEWCESPGEMQADSSFRRACRWACCLASVRLEPSVAEFLHSRNPSLRGELLQYLADASVPLWARWPMAKDMLIHDRSLPEAALTLCLEIAGEWLRQTAVEPSSWLSPITDRLCSVQDHAIFTEIARPFAHRWRALLNDVDKLGPRENLIAAVPLFARLKSGEDVYRISKVPQGLRSELLLVCELIRSGYVDDVPHVLYRLWQSEYDRLDHEMYEDMSTLRTTDCLLCFSSDIENQLAIVLQIFDDPGERALAELYLASLPDPSDAAHQATSTREQRLSALVLRVPNISFKSRFHRELFISKLLDFGVDASMLDEVLAETAGRIRWAQCLYCQPQAWGHACIRLLVRNAVRGMRQRDLSALRDVLDQFEELPDVNLNKFSYHSSLKYLIKCLVQQSPKLFRDIEPALFEPFLAELVRLRALDLGGNDRLLDPVVAVAVCRSRDAESARQFARELMDGDEHLIRRATNVECLWPIVASLPECAPEADLTQRLAMVRSIWQVAHEMRFTSRLIQADSTGYAASAERDEVAGGFDALEKVGLLDAAEILEFGPELARVYSVEGAMWRQLGFRLAAAGDWARAAEALSRMDCGQAPRSFSRTGQPPRRICLGSLSGFLPVPRNCGYTGQRRTAVSFPHQSPPPCIPHKKVTGTV